MTDMTPRPGERASEAVMRILSERQKQHDVDVSSIRVPVETGYITKYVAHCKDCGWEGRPSVTRTGAEYDGDEHIVAVAE